MLSLPPELADPVEHLRTKLLEINGSEQACMPNACRHGPKSSSYCCSSSWLANSSAAATVNTRPCWDRVIPQVHTGSTARTANSATSCTNSVKEVADNNNPANSDSAGTNGGICSGICVD